MRQSGAPRRLLAMFRDIFGCHDCMGGWGVGDRWHCHPTRHRTVPSNKEGSTKKGIRGQQNPALLSTSVSSQALPVKTPGEKREWNCSVETSPGGLWLDWTAHCSRRDYNRFLTHAWYIRPGHAFPTALSETSFGISGVWNKTKSPATKRPHPHRCPHLRWKVHSTGNKAAGQTTPLYLPQILPQPAARGKPHCERTLNYGCSFSWRLNFWQEVWTAVLLVVQPVTDGFFQLPRYTPGKDTTLMRIDGHAFDRTWFHITLQDSRGCIKWLLAATFSWFRPGKCTGHTVW